MYMQKNEIFLNFVSEMRGFGENRTKKGREKYWQLVTICYQLKGGGYILSYPFTKKRSLKRTSYNV